MAVQKAIDNLKDGPKENKVAVASGIAITVVVVLLVGWAIYFFHKIQRGTQQTNLTGGVQDNFNFTNVQEAQKQLEAGFGTNDDTFQQIRDESMSQGGSGTMQNQQMQIQGGGTNQFNPGSTY